MLSSLSVLEVVQELSSPLTSTARGRDNQSLTKDGSSVCHVTDLQEAAASCSASPAAARCPSLCFCRHCLPPRKCPVFRVITFIFSKYLTVRSSSCAPLQPLSLPPPTPLPGTLSSFEYGLRRFDQRRQVQVRRQGSVPAPPRPWRPT